MRRLSSQSIAARLSAFVLALVAASSFSALAASLEVSGANARAASPAADAPRLQPNALLTIDQNRATVVDRIVREWGDSLTWSNAGINSVQLREMLNGLRADHLLAASLAGSLEGLRNSLATALASSAEVSRGLVQAKALGDTADDIVYTPVTPCRLADTRVAGGAIAAFTTRNFKVWVSSGGFTAQGGDAGNCNVPANPAAAVLNFAAVNPGGTGNLIAYPTGGTLPNTSVLNYQSGIAALSNGAIIPACVPACANQLSVKANGPTVDVVIDIVGYFARPKNYGGTHVITGQYATDSGGQNNTASGDYSTVAGGSNNTAGGSVGHYTTVSGGYTNTASGLGSSVAGGYGNTASGLYGSISGGYLNTASGTRSFAAGYYATAAHDGCFVWSDNSTASATSCFQNNEFISRALGGYYFYTAGTADANYTGATLGPGTGAWATYSDRNGKANVERVNARAVLRKLVSMPIATWNWKAQDARIRHMGPMAQDFSAAFGLGEDDKHISTVDADGVALAAIQGLHQMVQQKDVKLRKQDREIARLKTSAIKVEALQRELEAIKLKLGLN